uniref:Uncharacterized protein n=1 Tax=Trichuris muris TaxID=70415 RepID=A0A5S6R3M6_TRIMR
MSRRRRPPSCRFDRAIGCDVFPLAVLLATLKIIFYLYLSITVADYRSMYCRFLKKAQFFACFHFMNAFPVFRSYQPGCDVMLL